MTVKNDETTDEVIKLLESSGISLTDAEKETLRKHREDQQQRQESSEHYQRAQIVHLCKHLGVSGRALIQRSLNSYLASCRRSARTQRSGIDTRAIYAARRY